MSGSRRGSEQRLEAIERQLAGIAEQVQELAADVTNALDRFVKVIGHSVIAGFEFRPTDPRGSTLLPAERHRGGVIDFFEVKANQRAAASRFVADHAGRPHGSPVWHNAGGAVDVIVEILALPRHGSPGAPRD